MTQRVITLIRLIFIVQDLHRVGDFLKGRAIDSLAMESLMLTEGGPTDSESLTWLFHFHGINMRYLGQVLQRFRSIMSKD